MVRPGRFVLCLALLAGACSGTDDDPGGGLASAPTTTSSAAASAPSTTTPADPFAIPEVIDAAYVNRVLAALYAIDGDVTREVLRTRTVGAATVDMQGQLFSGTQLQFELEDLAQVVQDDPALYKDPPGDRHVDVLSILVAKVDCVVALVESDFSDVVVMPPPKDPSMVGLVALVAAPDRIRQRGINPTPWTIALARLVHRTNPSEAATPCR